MHDTCRFWNEIFSEVQNWCDLWLTLTEDIRLIPRIYHLKDPQI